MSVYRRILAPIIYLPSVKNVNHFSKSSFRKFCYHPLEAAGKTKNYSTDGCGQEKDPLVSGNFVKFENMIDERRKEAERSLIVQVSSENSCTELHNYCAKFCTINSMFYYSCKSNHFVLVEFDDIASCEILSSYDYNGLCIKSPFVWFKIMKGSKIKASKSEGSLPIITSAQCLSEDDIVNWMSAAQSLSDEMMVLYESTKLSELGLRQRMLCARQVEMALSGLFPKVRALPFGSTVNSFGKEGCDLDLTVAYNGLKQTEETDRRLIYQKKTVGSNSRGQTQRNMELLGDILQVHVPGVVSVRKILGARVPIVKYSHNYTGLEVDISITNMSSVYMSEVLYLWGRLDPSARPLVFTVKAWAKAVGLTNPHPGRWITNFSLTLLVIFYLQYSKRLPSLDHLIALAGKEDERFAEDLNCTFARDPVSLDLTCQQHQPLEELLKGLFQFYQNFDFSSHGVSVCTGSLVYKPDSSPLYIVNPLERTLNVSKNVSIGEVENLRMNLRDALWKMENNERLISLIKSCPRKSMVDKFVPRLVTVKDLFADR